MYVSYCLGPGNIQKLANDSLSTIGSCKRACARVTDCRYFIFHFHRTFTCRYRFLYYYFYGGFVRKSSRAYRIPRVNRMRFLVTLEIYDSTSRCHSDWLSTISAAVVYREHGSDINRVTCIYTWDIVNLPFLARTSAKCKYVVCPVKRKRE